MSDLVTIIIGPNLLLNRITGKKRDLYKIQGSIYLLLDPKALDDMPVWPPA